MFGFSSKHESVVYGALIDVGSGSVGVAITENNPENESASVLFAHRVNTHIGGTGNSQEQSLRQLREALISACLVLSQDGTRALRDYSKKARISKILLTVSAPWSTTLAREVTYDHGEPVLVTTSLLNDLIASAEHEIESVVQDLPLMQSLDLHIVERITTGITINDYQVANPKNLTGSTIGLTHITGLVVTTLVDWVREITEKILPGVPINTHTMMLATYCVLRDIFPDSNSCCTINVTGEATEFGIVEDGNLVLTTSSPYGAHSVVRDIAKRTNKAPSDVISLLRSATAGTLTASEEKVVREYLLAYTSTLTDTISFLAESRSLPALLVITAQPQFQSVFTDAIKTAFAKASSGQTFTVTHIPEDVLKQTSESIPLDTYLAISSRFFHKIHVCGERTLS